MVTYMVTYMVRHGARDVEAGAVGQDERTCVEPLHPSPPFEQDLLHRVVHVVAHLQLMQGNCIVYVVDAAIAFTTGGLHYEMSAEWDNGAQCCW